MAKIIIYSTPTCVYCKLAKTFFNENSIAYEERDVTENDGWLDEMVKKSNQMGVPVIDIDGSIVVGFDKNKVKELAGI
ncbi:MAG TPA: glutaredoxin family protein [Candidatus Paceibacterota bacterium]